MPPMMPVHSRSNSILLKANTGPIVMPSPKRACRVAAVHCARRRQERDRCDEHRAGGKHRRQQRLNPVARSRKRQRRCSAASAERRCRTQCAGRAPSRGRAHRLDPDTDRHEVHRDEQLPGPGGSGLTIGISATTIGSSRTLDSSPRPPSRSTPSRAPIPVTRMTCAGPAHCIAVESIAQLIDRP